jgi:ubiquinone/menaquinone biosynthesis C-methylase UbiE
MSNKDINNSLNNDAKFLSYTKKRRDIQFLNSNDYLNFFSNFYHNSLLRIYKKIVTPGAHILEIGCGEGRLLMGLDGSYSVGIDFCPHKIEFAKRIHSKGYFFVMDAHTFSLPDKKFDYIILSDLLNDVWDVQKVLEQISPYCSEDTRIILNIFSHLWNIPLTVAKIFRLAKPQLSQNWLTYSDLLNILRICNYEIISHRREILLPAPVFNSFFNRFLVNIFPLNQLALTNFFIARKLVGASNLKPSVSIIIPARNESGNIREILTRIPDLSSETEIIFIEGNSTDNTYETIQNEINHFPEKNCKLLKQFGTGKGDAVRLGFEAANNEILMILDADMTVPPEDLSKFYLLFLSGKAEFINGVRLIYPMEDQAMRFLNLVGNKFFSIAFSWLLGQPIRDTLCGTKVLSKANYLRISANRSYFGDFDPFGDFDLLFGAAKLQLKILEVPIRYRARIYGETNISRWSHGLLLLRMVLFASVKIKFI